VRQGAPPPAADPAVHVPPWALSARCSESQGGARGGRSGGSYSRACDGCSPRSGTPGRGEPARERGNGGGPDSLSRRIERDLRRLMGGGGGGDSKVSNGGCGGGTEGWAACGEGQSWIRFGSEHPGRGLLL
jgi:hypothetical protein